MALLVAWPTCRQGTHRLGFVEAPPLPANSDILSSAAFQLRHLRPGTVSLNLVGGLHPCWGPGATVQGVV